MEKSFNSSETNDFVLKSETLDRLYRDQVAELRNMLLKNAQASDIDVCLKWIKVFNQSTKEEQFARNCLCTLMHRQFQESGCLSEPFINLNNCKRNLKSVLDELDNETQIDSLSFKTEFNVTYKSHGGSCIDRFVKSHEMEINQDSSLDQINAEMIQLKHQMDNLRLQLSERDFENQKLRALSEKYRQESESQFCDVKNNILNCIRKKLLNLRHCTSLPKNLELFPFIFKTFSNDPEFMQVVKDLDSEFEQILRNHFVFELKNYKCKIVKQLCQNILKKQTKLRRKYEKRLKIQNITQRLQLKLARLKCISEMRQIFIQSQTHFGKIELWEILHKLEGRYEAILND